MLAAIDAGHQRAEFAVGGLPAAQHDFVPGAAFGLGPVLGAAGAIGRAELLGDDAFQRQLAGRLQHGIAAAFEMFDIADQLCPCPCRASSNCFSRALRSRERQRRRSSPSANSRSNAKKIRSSVLPSDSAACSAGEIRRAVVVERDDLAVDQQSGSALRLLGDGRELVGPVQALAGLQRGLAVLDAQLHAIAVELDLVAPAVAAGGRSTERAELRRDEIRHRGDLPAFALRRGRACALRALAVPFRVRCARLGGLAAVRMPDRVGLGAAGLCHHERLWRLALAGGDLAPSIGPRRPIDPLRGCCWPRPRCANSSRCLISSQLVRLPPLRSLRIRTSTQLPCSLSPSQREFQVALLEAALGIVAIPSSRDPRAAPCRRHTGLWEWCLRNRHSRADDPRPPPPAACRADRARAPWSPPRT